MVEKSDFLRVRAYLSLTSVVLLPPEEGVSDHGCAQGVTPHQHSPLLSCCHLRRVWVATDAPRECPHTNTHLCCPAATWGGFGWPQLHPESGPTPTLTSVVLLPPEEGLGGHSCTQRVAPHQHSPLLSCCHLRRVWVATAASREWPHTKTHLCCPAATWGGCGWPQLHQGSVPTPTLLYKVVNPLWHHNF